MWASRRDMTPGSVGWRHVTTLILTALAIGVQPVAHGQRDERPRVSVRPAADFEVTGTGEHAAWRQGEWVALRRREPDGHAYETRFKTVYSGTGLYFLID